MSYHHCPRLSVVTSGVIGVLVMGKESKHTYTILKHTVRGVPSYPNTKCGDRGADSRNAEHRRDCFGAGSPHVRPAAQATEESRAALRCGSRDIVQQKKALLHLLEARRAVLELLDGGHNLLPHFF
jgi:hypothetical protein